MFLEYLEGGRWDKVVEVAAGKGEEIAVEVAEVGEDEEVGFWW